MGQNYEREGGQENEIYQQILSDMAPAETEPGSQWDRNRELTKDLIVELSIRGVKDHGKISDLTGCPQHNVAVILRNHATAKRAARIENKVYKEVLKEKVPLLEDIVKLSLGTVKDFLVSLKDTPGRKEALTVREARELSGIAKDLNEVLRLELGQSTQNVEVVQYSYDQAVTVIKELKELDPVFDYEEPLALEGGDGEETL